MNISDPDRLVVNDGASTSTGSSGKLSTKSLKNLVESLRTQCYHNSTKQNYYRIWRAFSSFYFKLDVKPETWEERITLFIAQLINENKQSSTIKSYISGLRAVLKQDKIELSENQFLITSLTKAACLRNDKIKLRLPIQKPMLALLLHHVREYYEGKRNQYYLSILYQTMLAVGHYGLCRVGELASGDHPIRASDVHVGTNKDKFMLVLWTSKTHWRNVKPQIIKISSEYSPSTEENVDQLEPDYPIPCPYQLLRIFTKIRGPYVKDSDEPYFVFTDGSPVKPFHVRKCLNKILKLAKFDPSYYSFHSMRAGRSQDLLELGLSVETIMKIGRWKSNAVFCYLH